MIIREWRGRASPSNVEAYPKHFRDKVIPELRQVPGFLWAHLGQRQLDDRVEFLVITGWRSMDAIQAFAGVDIDKAIVDPDAIVALIEYDTKATHYQVVEEVSS
jgi:heme-degrading monooxygenase HmoA